MGKYELVNVRTGQTADFGSVRGYERARRLTSVWKAPQGTGTPDGKPEPVRAPPIAVATVAQVLEWVGDDPDRAEEALQLEESRPDGPRKTLNDALEPIAIRPKAG